MMTQTGSQRRKKIPQERQRHWSMSKEHINRNKMSKNTEWGIQVHRENVLDVLWSPLTVPVSQSSQLTTNMHIQSTFCSFPPVNSSDHMTHFFTAVFNGLVTFILDLLTSNWVLWRQLTLRTGLPIRDFLCST